MTEGANSCMSVFADYVKLLRRVENEEDNKMLLGDLDKVWEWSKQQEKEFNHSNYSAVEFGKRLFFLRVQLQITNWGMQMLTKEQIKRPRSVNYE